MRNRVLRDFLFSPVGAKVVLVAVLAFLAFGFAIYYRFAIIALIKQPSKRLVAGLWLALVSGFMLFWALTSGPYIVQYLLH